MSADAASVAAGLGRSAPAAPAGIRGRVASWIDSAPVQRAIIALVVLNAVTLGLETVPPVAAVAGDALRLADRVLLAVFVVELGLKILGHGRRFFASGWNVFDFAVVAVALVPASGPLSVFRALRVLRILRVISAVPKLRVVVESLVRSLPGMGAISLLLFLFFYVFAVVATKLFGAEFPHWFGSLWISAFSLFQVMTLEGWADIAREVMAAYPAAWLFFVAFILMSTFTVLNLFIGLIVKAMEEPIGSAAQEGPSVREELAALREELRRLAAPVPRYARSSARSRNPARDSGFARAARLRTGRP